MSEKKELKEEVRPERPNDDRETSGIRVIFVLEVVGRPPEHLNKTLEDLITKIGDVKGVEVLSKKINEPVPMKENKDFFTNFAEVELEVEDCLTLTSLTIDIMPSHVEVLSPELIVLNNTGWNEVLNDTTRKLHGYDEVARVMQVQNQQLQNKVRDLEKK